MCSLRQRARSTESGFEFPTVQPPNPKAKPLGTSPHQWKMKKTAEKVQSDSSETELLRSTAWQIKSPQVVTLQYGLIPLPAARLV